jgi:P2-related tail formation protein
MKQTAVEWYAEQGMTLEISRLKGEISTEKMLDLLFEKLRQAKEMEKKQLFLSANTQAKQAYKAGQKSMYCGCYEISGCTSFEDWLYNKTFKSE